MKTIFIDIETEANPDVEDLVKIPSAPSSWKDEKKIAEYAREKKEEAIEKMALDPDYGKISAISYGFVDDAHALNIRTLIVEKNKIPKSNIYADFFVEKSKCPILTYSICESEFFLLRDFFSSDIFSFSGGVFCGFNLLSFDLPYIMRRAMTLRIPDSKRFLPFDLAKYRTGKVLDLMQILYNWNTPKSLKWIVKRYHLDNPLPDLDGSQYATMDLETRIAYVSNDIYLTWQLYEMMKGYYF